MKKDTDELFEDYQEFPIRIGQSLPDMELSAYHKGKETKISLSDYKGKWLILFFYPADFTFICPTELEDMADHYAQFQKEGAEVLSVSTDTVYTHKAWHDT
jgi:peroxiredoxin (alkyl hydroperoxide reductase subunit C)